MKDEEAQSLRVGDVVWVTSKRKTVSPRQAKVLGVEVRPFSAPRRGRPETYTVVELLLDGDLWNQTPALLSREEPKA